MTLESIDIRKIHRFRILLKIVGIYELIVGLFGVVLLGFDFDAHKYVSFSSLILFLIVGGYFLFSLYAGFKLFFETENKIRLSFITQYFQIPLILTANFGYMLYVGAFALIRIVDTGLNFKFGFSCYYIISMISQSKEFFIGINLFPILIIILLKLTNDKLKSAIVKNKSFEESIIER